MDTQTYKKRFIFASLLLSFMTLANAERGGRPGGMREPVQVDRGAVNRVDRNTVNRTVINRDVNRRGFVDGGVYVAPADNVYVVPSATTLPAGCVWVPAYTDENGDVIPGHQSC